MALDPVINFGKVTVSTGYNSTDTSIVLSSGDGNKLPATFSYNLVWWNASSYSNPADDPNVEIVRCTNRSGDTLTINRGQEGTTATVKNIGTLYLMILAPTKKMIDDIDTHITDTTIHYIEGSIDHLNLLNIGINSHTTIDTHIADNTIHFLESSINHGSLLGLGVDDHSQYALLAGRSGGQTLTGGTLSGEDLILNPTSHATKGKIAIPTNTPLEFRPGVDGDMDVINITDQGETVTVRLDTNSENNGPRWNFIGRGGILSKGSISNEFFNNNDATITHGMHSYTQVTYKTTGNYEFKGIHSDIMPSVQSGVSYSGAAVAIQATFSDVVGSALLIGTLQEMTMFKCNLTMTDNVSPAAGTITNAIGLLVDITKNWSTLEPTITNGYGIKINSIQATNAWGVYVSPAINNWLAGSLGIGAGNSSPSSTLSVAGSVEFKAVAVSVNTTLTVSDCIIFVDASGGAVTITLPTPVIFNPSRVYWIYKTDTSINAVTIAAGGSDSIVGITSITTQYDMVKIVGFTSTSWLGT